MPRELAPILSAHGYDVVAAAPSIVRVDIDTEDGGTVCALLTLEAANRLSRDLARAVHHALRME